MSELNPFYDAAVYTLLFPSGTPGYTPDIILPNGEKVTMMDYYKFHFMLRDHTIDYFAMNRLWH